MADSSGGMSNPYMQAAILQYLQAQTAAAQAAAPSQATQGLNQVNQTDTAAGGTSALAAAVKMAMQASGVNSALDGQLNNQADAGAYGDQLQKNPQAMLPFLQGQEKTLASKQKAALMQWKATQDNRDNTPGLHGSSGSGGPPPRWLTDTAEDTMPSYEQSRVLNWHAANPDADPTAPPTDTPRKYVDPYGPGI